MIYFYPSIVCKTLEVIKDATDCKTVCNDLARIKAAKAEVEDKGDCAVANLLDQELRKKYPYIILMLTVGDQMLTLPIREYNTNALPVMQRLDQDYYGILCDTAIKKGVIKDPIEFIQNVK